MITQSSKWAGILFMMMLAAGCDRPSPVAPLSPSGAGVRITESATPNFQPILAQLNRVENFLISANHQLDLVFHPPGPCIPSSVLACPGGDQHLQSALDFYVKANGVLDAQAVKPPNPNSPPALDALDAIIGQANISLGLIVNNERPPGPPIIPSIILEAEHTISVANGLKFP